ncbi:NUDIX domain-containing protein [Streptoalloteichus tenebrarius]|uniref:NUDIX domain-containing protein n=2 Tax=Streptoalloteichus tenebrarius (strain ATCC 17920 / DSM 40477 / JCM 4838 / CBS 697.72 / NBRC 16177 / NCIMB 11028 / NRRL B-12390 / A12253. 1 / ISP 5477) TaxID=1933 RepID=A0ABT1HNP6_STRSD|nr:NUDIX hydrolase [Streptoalloteichus tenebrarius]MCP2257130.1 NUDIX domain-containing protein [Streptoalloteichus tenebrarius]
MINAHGDSPQDVERNWTLSLYAVRVAAHALVHHPLQPELVLVSRTVGRDYWQLPGGCLDDGEHPRQTAVRELKEEHDVDITLGRLLAVEWIPAGTFGVDGFPGATFVVYCYAAILPDARVGQDHAEIAEWAWLLPEEAADRMSEQQRGLMLNALDAERDGHTAELIDGHAQ